MHLLKQAKNSLSNAFCSPSSFDLLEACVFVFLDFVSFCSRCVCWCEESVCVRCASDLKNVFVNILALGFWHAHASETIANDQSHHNALVFCVSLVFRFTGGGKEQQLTSTVWFWILKKLLFNTLVASNCFFKMFVFSFVTNLHYSGFLSFFL